MGGNNGESMEWSEACEKYFLKVFAEKVRRDLNGAPTFKGTDWIEIDEQIFLKFALRYGQEKLKGKYNRFRLTHTRFTVLICNTGVTWDSITGKVSANDTVWDMFFKRDKAFRTFKNRGCKLYSLLDVVFSGSKASGTFHNASTTGPQTSEEEHRLEADYLGDGEGDSSTSKKRPFDGEVEPPRASRRVNKGKGNIDNLVDKWSEAMIARKEKDLAKVEHYKSRSNEVTKMVQEEASIDDCMRVLEAMPNVGTTSYN